MRTNKIIDVSDSQLENAKVSAIALTNDIDSAKRIDELFFTDNLSEIENGIRQLNETANKSWILSAILLYTLVYNQSLYEQSGLTWDEYMKQSRERLGLDQRDITDQLSGARFFIQYHEALKRNGWTIKCSNAILARGEFALELSGDLDETLKRMSTSTFTEFKEWYSSFKTKKALPYVQETKREDIEVEGFKIRGINAIQISDKLPEEEQEKLKEYVTQIFQILQDGNVPAIVSAYDQREARIIPKLRDNFRMGK